MTDKEAISMLCVSMFLRDIDNAANDPTYKESAERKDLVKTLCKATGATQDGLLAKLFLCYVDGFEAGLGFRDKLDNTAG